MISHIYLHKSECSQPVHQRLLVLCAKESNELWNFFLYHWQLKIKKLFLNSDHTFIQHRLLKCPHLDVQNNTPCFGYRKSFVSKITGTNFQNLEKMHFNIRVLECL